MNQAIASAEAHGLGDEVRSIGPYFHRRHFFDRELLANLAPIWQEQLNVDYIVLLGIGIPEQYQHYREKEFEHTTDDGKKRRRIRRWTSGTRLNAWLLTVRLDDQAIAWRITAQNDLSNVEKDVRISFTGGNVGEDFVGSLIMSLLTPSASGYAPAPGVTPTAAHTVRHIGNRLP